ncbi:hypothetical protein E6C27_scaffold89G001400 [Cucumis melo var. makuwa]|uniref:Uncharacterized protein n=1 Tax=Cucumis melo var. makuwa TaxID=1194695 RepID=A0A5A7V3M9_CUCMM|nr:hypothetical protein E6C27_scaffold89G001400 [Cucumis melo var. makuwa]
MPSRSRRHAVLLLLLFSFFTRRTQPPSARFCRPPPSYPHITDGIPKSASDRLQPTSLSLFPSPPLPTVSPSSSRVPDADRTPRGAALFRRRCRVEKGFEPEPRIEVDPSRIRELTLKFSGFVAGLFGASFPFLEGNVTASCSLCAIGCKELFTDRHRYPGVLYIVVMLMGYVMDWNYMSMNFKVLRLGVSFGITRLIHVSFGITRLICTSFGITRLICASFGITRLIGASFGITRLIGKGTARGRPTRGKKDV